MAGAAAALFQPKLFAGTTGRICAPGDSSAARYKGTRDSGGCAYMPP